MSSTNTVSLYYNSSVWLESKPAQHYGRLSTLPLSPQATCVRMAVITYDISAFAGYTVHFNIHGTHVIANNSTNNYVLYFFVPNLKI